MHVAFALMIGVPLARLSRHRVTRVVWSLYPLLVTFVIVATANHFLADAVLGAVTVGAAASTRRVARPRPARAPGPSARRAPDAGTGTPTRPPRSEARSRAYAERRERVRNRLIESRLTPNAISLTGLVGCLVAAVLVWEELLRPRRHRVRRRLGMRHARRALLADVGQGHAVRRVPGLDARPRSRRASSSPRSPTSSPSRAATSPRPPCVVAVLASLMVSYTRARAEALGVECKVGIASRAVRVVDPVRRPAVRRAFGTTARPRPSTSSPASAPSRSSSASSTCGRQLIARGAL